jgi:hypothetical protein
MSSYEDRLDAFVRGRRFARMSRPVRNRADSWCDACGSVQARVLFGVQEEASKAVYFVGEHCLQQLAERGAIVRRFLRLSAEEAYAARCQARANPESVAPASAEEAASAGPPDRANGPESLTAFLILAAPGRRQAPLILPMGEGAARRALDSLRDAPGLRKQLRDLGLGGMSGGPAEVAAVAPAVPEPAGNDAARLADDRDPHKTSVSRRKPLATPPPESSPGAA